MDLETKHICVKNAVVHNFEGAIRGMRNPLRSWEKSDSGYSNNAERYSEFRRPVFEIGTNDLKLAQNLSKAGSDHRKYLRQIMVSMDISAPRYWWTEFDTYKVGTAANSESTMHTIHKRPFDREDFVFDGYLIQEPQTGMDMIVDPLLGILTILNEYRDLYLTTKNVNAWRAMIQLLPQSYIQMRSVTLNYEVLMKMYWARKDHKLVEWRDFCKYLYTLPYFYELCVKPFEEE